MKFTSKPCKSRERMLARLTPELRKEMESRGEGRGAGLKGTGEYTVTSSKEWHFSGPNGVPVAQGSDIHATQEVTARWKGSDCGNVAPRSDG